jgi:hypothetical protein
MARLPLVDIHDLVLADDHHIAVVEVVPADTL